MPKAVADALVAHVEEFPVANREALIFPRRDWAQLAHGALYGLPARTEVRQRRTYRKEASDFLRARRDRQARSALARPAAYRRNT